MIFSNCDLRKDCSAKDSTVTRSQNKCWFLKIALSKRLLLGIEMQLIFICWFYIQHPCLTLFYLNKWNHCRFSTYTIIVKNHTFVSSFLILLPFIMFSYLSSLASSVMLNKSDKNKHPWFVYFIKDVFNILPLKCHSCFRSLVDCI